MTKRSSPTSWTRPPRRSVSVCQVGPVVLGEPVLDRDDREPVGEVGPEVDHPVPVERAALPLEHVGAVAVELARGGIERDRDLVAVPGPLGGLEDRLAGVVGRAEVGSEAALVADARREAALLEERLQRVVALDADPERLGERRRAGGHEHELLEVERVLGVGAAVDDVHQRHGQDVGVGAADPAVERQLGVGGGGLRDRERDAEDRVRAEPRLRRRPVELDHGAVDLALLARVHARRRGRRSRR